MRRPDDSHGAKELSATLLGVRLARAALTSDQAFTEHWQSLDAERQDGVKTLATALQSIGVVLLLPGDRQWPRALTDLPAPPPFLFAQGALALLDEPAIGICGSRNASERGLRAARTAGQEAARNGMHIISGYARGVDTQTHLAALEEGAGTVIVLAEGIQHFRIKRDFRQMGLSPDRVLVLSQFPPSQRWTVGAAMARNAIICALGKAMVVVEAGETGGTLNAGRQALKLGRPVLALQFGDETPAGNRLLFDEGARRVASTGDLRSLIAGLTSREEAHGAWPRTAQSWTPRSAKTLGSGSRHC